MITRSLHIIRFCLIVLAAEFILSGCGSSDAPPAPPRTPVSVARVESKDMPVTLIAVGSVEPSESATVLPQVSGILREIHLKEGQEVQGGDLLFTIDPLPYQEKVNEQAANLQRAEAEAKNASATLARYDDLVKKEFVTKEQYDQTRANASSSAAAVKGAQAALENAKLELSYCSLRAPIAGRTGEFLVKVGNLVNANDASKPLLTIRKVKPVLVRFTVAEEHLPAIREGAAQGKLKVIAQAKGENGAELVGSLSFIDNSVDRTTGTVLLKGEFGNENGALWAGQFVDVSLVLRTAENSLVIPSEAILTGQQGDYLWVVKPDQGVEQRKIKVAFRSGEVAVIEKGVEKGDQVVIDGQVRLGPNSKVEVKNQTTNAPKAEPTPQ